MPSF